MTMTIAAESAETVVRTSTVEKEFSCEIPQPFDGHDDEITDRNSVSDGSISSDHVSENSGDSPTKSVGGELESSSDEGESDSDSESEEEDDDGEEENPEDMPDGDTTADLHALLAFSKSRLEKAPEPPPAPSEEAAAEVMDDDEESVDSEMMEEQELLGEEDGSEAAAPPEEDTLAVESQNSASEENTPAAKRGVTDLVIDASSSSLLAEEKKESANDVPSVTAEEDLLQIAQQKLREAEAKAEEDDPESEILKAANEKLRIVEEKAQSEKPEKDQAHLFRMAEEKVRLAEEKAQLDEAQLDGDVIKPKPAPNRRSDANAELWALLNYSKKRLETGATPQVKKSSKAGGDDNASVSSKRSANSRKSFASAKKSPTSADAFPGHNEAVVAVDSVDVGQAQQSNSVENDTQTADDGSEENIEVSSNVSVASGMKDQENEEDESLSDEESSDEESDDSDEDDDEEEDELPDFLKSDETDKVNAEEEKRLYEAARSYGASVLSVAEENLTDVQLMQALAVATEAARNGEEKFSTKSSLFKLHEANLEDIKAIFDMGMRSSPKNASARGEGEGEGGNGRQRRKSGRWGAGKGRFFQKVGNAFSDFKTKCDAVDDRKRRDFDKMSKALQDFKKTCDAVDARKRRERESSDATFVF